MTLSSDLRLGLFTSRAFRSLTTALGACLILAMPDPAKAEWEFVGYSTTTVKAEDRFVAMHQACQTDFSPESRTCFSAELMASPGVTSETTFSALVLPTIVGFSDSLNAIDASGIFDYYARLTCSPGGPTHLTFYPPTGRFATDYCTTARPVACCERVASTMVPTMSAIGPTGRALLVALIILTLGAYGLRRGRTPVGGP